MTNYHGQRVSWANRLLKTRWVNLGRITYIPGGYCGPRRQRDYQLVIVHSGAAEVTVDNEKRSLPKDHAALFLPGHREYFQFSRTESTQHSWCAVRPSFMPKAYARKLEKSPGLLPCSELMHRILSAGQGLGRVVIPEQGLVAEQLSMALFAEYLHLAATRTQASRHDEGIQRALAYMEEHFGADDCLIAARAAATCSESGLNQRFRKVLGISPARHLWGLRVERGVCLLRETGLSVAEISIRCGFKNPFHFSRLVRQCQGKSPRALRREAWG